MTTSSKVNNTSDSYLNMLYENRKKPKAWMWTGKHLRLSADAIYARYLESKDWLEQHSMSSQKYAFEFSQDFADKNDNEMMKHLENLHILQPYFFLEACALENAIKAILISKNPDFVPDTKNKFATHNLNELFKKAEISLGKFQQNLLDRLSDSIYGAGRYPYPLKRECFQYKPVPDGGVLLAGYYKEGDHELIDALWAILVTKWYRYLEQTKNRDA